MQEIFISEWQCLNGFDWNVYLSFQRVESTSSLTAQILGVLREQDAKLSILSTKVQGMFVV